MFGVLYAASSEVFPGKHRGTGNGLTATAARVFSVLVRSLLPGTDMSPWPNYARVRAGSHYCIVRVPGRLQYLDDLYCVGMWWVCKPLTVTFWTSHVCHVLSHVSHSIRDFGSDQDYFPLALVRLHILGLSIRL